MTVIVDSTTFSALHLSQAAIAFARNALPYGSANQWADWQRLRPGGPSQGEQLPRLNVIRDGIQAIMRQRHSGLPPYFGTGLNAHQIYYSGIATGVAMFYGAGNCGEHAMLTFSFLCTFGFPGITVQRVSSTVVDHAYTVITWQGCKDAVICDAWPTRPQACLWSHFFANPKRQVPDPGFRTVASFTIPSTPTNYISDIVGDSFRAVNPALISRLPSQSLIAGYTPEAIAQFLRDTNNGLYNHVYTVAKQYQQPQQPYVEYQYNGQNLSTVAPRNEQWSGTVLPAILEVNNQLKVLDPNQRYTGTRIS